MAPRLALLLLLLPLAGCTDDAPAVPAVAITETVTVSTTLTVTAAPEPEGEWTYIQRLSNATSVFLDVVQVYSDAGLRAIDDEDFETMEWNMRRRADESAAYAARLAEPRYVPPTNATRTYYEKTLAFVSAYEGLSLRGAYCAEGLDDGDYDACEPYHAYGSTWDRASTELQAEYERWDPN